ncbi:MAG: Asparagine synthase, glutamine-hydrolyzing [Actinomycetia bacterium]|nr:Asparagine synthase, glutamine-hydrolyzing [Actinomycetes bacterium]
MCGIAGLAAPGTAAAPAIETEPGLLGHRGPDGGAVAHWQAAGATGVLMHTRLAIVDLSSDGQQPMTDERGRFLVAFNGEIYNHLELRRLCASRGHALRSQMDGEVIVHLWEDEGAACLSRLNGVFAVSVVDTLTGEVWLARDPLGVKPLFRVLAPNRIWFASEPAALAALGADTGGWDVAALAQFLTFLWVPDPRTPYANVRSVLPGHVLHWRPGRGVEAAQEPYAAPLHPTAEPRRISLAGAAGELTEHLRAACERQLLGDVPVGLMASGGVDSSLLWWAGGKSLTRAYTIEWQRARGGEGLDEDARMVRTLQRHFGSPVSFVAGQECEDGSSRSGDLFADPAFGLTSLIAARARADGFKVLWSGQGGDELLAGYRRHRVAHLLEDRPAAVLRRLGRVRMPAIGGGPAAEYAGRLVRACAAPSFFERYLYLCTYSDAPERARVLDCTVAEVADEVVHARHRDVFEQLPADLSPLRRALTLDLNVYLPGLGLAYVDRAGMRHGVEIRVPWLDLELVRWSLDLPDQVLAAEKGKGPARVLARTALPSLVADRPKRGFAAPVGLVRRGAGTAGGRGNRQAEYFARAAGTVTSLLAGVAAPGGSAVARG